MPAVTPRVLAAVEAGRAQHIALLRDLIAAQRSGEAAVQDIVAGRLQAIGAGVARIVYEPAEIPLIGEFAASGAIVAGSRASVVGSLPGSGAGPSLLLFAHPDSETVQATETWRHDPFAGVIADGRLYGWGVADDLLGVAAGIAAMTVVAEQGGPGGRVTLASTPSKRHARGVAAIMHRGILADAAVYLHPAESGAGLREIKAFASGQLEFRVTLSGRKPPTTEPGHTAFAHLAVNPLDKAWLIHAALRALDARRGAVVRHPRLQDAVGRSTNLLVSGITCGDTARYSRVPERCTLSGAVAFPPSERMADVLAEIEAAIDEAARADDWLAQYPPRIEWVAGVTGLDIPEAHPLLRTVSDAVAAVAGFVPAVNPMHTSSDIRVPLVQHGIPTVGLGPLAGSLTQTGGSDEWVDVEDYLRMIAITAAIILAWTHQHPVADIPPQ